MLIEAHASPLLCTEPPMAESSSAAAASVANAAKRLREEAEAAKNRLLDQQFHISKSSLLPSSVSTAHAPLALTGAIRLCVGRYADPLVPRKTSDPQFWPKDVTREMEQRWLAMIKEHRSV